LLQLSHCWLAEADREGLARVARLPPCVGAFAAVGGWFHGKKAPGIEPGAVGGLFVGDGVACANQELFCALCRRAVVGSGFVVLKTKGVSEINDLLVTAFSSFVVVAESGGFGLGGGSVHGVVWLVVVVALLASM